MYLKPKRLIFPVLVATFCLMLLSACQLQPLPSDASMGLSATEKSDASSLFTLHSDAWLLSQADEGIDWGSFRTDPGAIIFHDGQYHMFRNVFGGFPGPVEIGYATSPDGIDWTDVTDGPILRSADVESAGIAAVVTGALVEDDGTWVLYFHTWLSPSPSLGRGDIGRATAPSPEGPWTVDAELVLSKGSAEEWDGGQVSQASVVRTEHDSEERYVMSYTGADRRGFMRIGIATSEDGIQWAKYNDPLTSIAPFAESDPVIVPDLDGWDDGSAYMGRMVNTTSGWLMVYKSLGAGLGPKLGMAVSDDGITWHKTANGPIMDGNLIPNALGFGHYALAQHEDELRLYTEFFGWEIGSGIYLLKSNAELTNLPHAIQDTEMAKKARQLNYVAYWGGNQARSWDKQNWRAYEAENPDLAVQWAGADNYGSPANTNIVADVTSENPPDVVSGNIVGVMREYVDQGLIADISELWAEEGWDEAFPTTLKEMVTFDGKQYFVPQAIQFNGIFYRQDIFVDAGVSVPETWDELLTACDALNNHGVTPMTITASQWPPPIGFWFSHINMRLNGPDFHDRLMRGQERYDDPRVREVFTYWLQLFEHKCFSEESAGNNYSAAMTEFASGEAAMYAHGTWLYQFYPADQADQLGFFRFPIIDPEQPLGELVPLYGAFIPAKASNPEEARAFLAYLGSVESQQSNFDALGRIASHMGVDQSQYHDVLQQGWEMIENAEYVTQLYGANTQPSLALAAYFNGFIPFWQEPTPEKADEILTYIESVRAQIYSE
ncbi:MAG: extracellular solute-binding protein [Chloroflexota bacterium]